MRLLNVAAEFTNWNPVIDKIRPFVDSGVLITAARGSGESAHDALAILDDPDREFVSSFFIRLEVIPKPSYFNRESELSFYNNFFDAVAIWAIRGASSTMPSRLPAHSDFRPWTHYMLPQLYRPARRICYH